MTTDEDDAAWIVKTIHWGFWGLVGGILLYSAAHWLLG